jgi:uncharacterized membrane protein YgdD (TMEM256/DUF423 family)
MPGDRISYDETMTRILLILAGVLGVTGVIAGAFGAHALRHSVGADQLEVWKTAVAYQMWHVLALMAVGMLSSTAAPAGRRFYRAAGWLFVAGIVVFSGSLYALVLVDVKWLGAITPVGGTAMIAGWVGVVLGAWKSK